MLIYTIARKSRKNKYKPLNFCYKTDLRGKEKKRLRLVAHIMIKMYFYGNIYILFHIQYT
ncbi:hypothetical protein, partial [Bacteroides congonensis]|uniref:hypothetical protein n=1 Tax=Bacteroides congonensis TaxID=1871006 RepID=UPI0026769DDE